MDKNPTLFICFLMIITMIDIDINWYYMSHFH